MPLLGWATAVMPSSTAAPASKDFLIGLRLSLFFSEGEPLRSLALQKKIILLTNPTTWRVWWQKEQRGVTWVSNGRVELSTDRVKVSDGRVKLSTDREKVSDAREELSADREKVSDAREELSTDRVKVSDAREELSTGREKASDGRVKPSTDRKLVSDGRVRASTDRKMVAAISGAVGYGERGV